MFIANIGSLFIGAAISGIGGVMWFFTKRHIASMDELTNKLGCLAEDVSGMRSDIRGMRDIQVDQGDRITRLEDRHLKPGGSD